MHLVHPDTPVLTEVPALPGIVLYPQRGLNHGDVLLSVHEPRFFEEPSSDEAVVLPGQAAAAAATQQRGPPPRLPTNAPSGCQVMCRSPEPTLGSDRPARGAQAGSPGNQSTKVMQRVAEIEAAIAAKPAQGEATPRGASTLGPSSMRPSPAAMRSLPTPFGRRVLALPNPGKLDDTAHHLCLPKPTPEASGDHKEALAQHSSNPIPADPEPPAPPLVIPPLALWETAWHSEPDCPVKGPAADLLRQRHEPGRWCPDAIHIYVDGSAGDGMKPGWAVVVCEAYAFPHAAWENVLGFFSGNTQAFAVHALAGLEDNMDSETVALAVASAWAAAWPPNVQLRVFCDCKALTDIALGVAEPHSQQATGRLQKACRCLWQTLQRRPIPAVLHWLASHQGCPGNELADQVAKQARSLVQRPLPESLFALLKHRQLPWLWHHKFPSQALPALPALQSSAYEAPDVVPRNCFPQAQMQQPRQTDATLTLSLCTFNVQSLAKKKDLCRVQFQQERIHVIFMQETRHRSGGTCAADDYIEFRSPAERGNGGCAIWLSKRLPHGQLQAKQVKILHQDPRRLLLRLKAARLDCFLFSGHAPHSGATESVADGWWHETKAILRKHVQPNIPLLAGLDANAQLGEITGPAIGAHAPDPETPNGERLRDFCDSHSLALPTTFASSTGKVLAKDPEAFTWVSPNGGKHRIDYIAVPQSCLEAVEWQGVWHSFETGGPDDHLPVCVKMRLRADAHPDVTCGFPRIGLRCVDDVRRAGLDLTTHLTQAAQIPWETNVHEHVAALDAAMWRAAAPATASKRPRKAYLDDTAWALVCARKQAKQRVVHTANNLHRTKLCLFFRAWKFARLSASPVSLCTHRLAQAHHAYFNALAEHRRLLPLLRKAIESSKAAYIASLAQRFENAAREQDARELYHALRHFRPAGKKVFKPFGPAVPLCDGEGATVQTHSAQQEAHRQHFEKQEAGEKLDLDEYCSAAPGLPPKGACTIADLPSLYDVEQVIRRAKDGRAPGPSGVPGCMWKAAPPAAAEALLPIYVKANLRLTEPVQYRGCRLVAMLKKACATARADNFRSIALLDPAAKFLHRLHRPTLVDEVQHKDLPLLQGCVPGGGPVALTHILQTALHTAKLRGTSAAILFLDLRSAYYRLVRQAVTGAEVSDADLCQLLHRLGVKPEHLQDVTRYATSGGMLNRASPHFKRVLACTFHATFFVMDDVPTATTTKAGSRPGDAISDILYGLAVADLTLEVRQELRAQGLPDAYMPTWADDISLPVTAPASSLLEVSSVVATTLHNACVRRAMAPNYDAGKTELLLAWHGEGARKHSTACYRTGRGHISLRTTPPEELACVTQYKHLGTTLRTTGGVRTDLRIKFAHAQTVVSPLMRPVFRRQTVPLEQRAVLLDTLAITRATYGVAIWHHLNQRDEALWSHGLSKLYRALHRPRIVDGAPHFPTASLICYQSGRPCPVSQRKLLILEHARFLGGQQLERLFDLLHEEAELSEHSWLAEAQTAFGWLQELVGPRMVKHGVTDLTTFLDHSLHRPSQVKGWLRKARHLSARRAPVDPDPDGPSTATGQTEEAIGHVGCEICHQQFPDVHSARAHMWAKHGHGTLLSQLAPSTRCPCCLTEFWRHSRLLRHLAHDRPNCGHHLLAAPPALLCSRVPPATSRRETLPTDTLPAVRAVGPLPLPQHAGVSADQLSVIQSFFEECGPEAADFAYAARQAVSEFECANTATRDAALAGLDCEAAARFCEILLNAGVSV
ncbi:unnamed protein product [Symbiodinium sp. CCMP2592]|nr:unnamed protein product [Symbiodinium sp. CCMP2592]